MNATEIAAALKYTGRRCLRAATFPADAGMGRYWTIGDTSGVKNPDKVELGVGPCAGCDKSRLP